MGRKRKTDSAPATMSDILGAASSESQWASLLSSAEAALDDHGLETLERRRKAAAKKIRRETERGTLRKFDIDGVRRALVAYYRDRVEGDSSKGFRKVFAEVGANLADYLVGRDYYPDLRTVFEYIRDKSAEIAEIEASEMARQAQESQKRLVTEEGCDLNQRAVELSLKATMKNVYGDGKDGNGGADSRKTINYSFPNMNMTWIVAPSEIAAKKALEAKPQPEAIDV